MALQLRKVATYLGLVDDQSVDGDEIYDSYTTDATYLNVDDQVRPYVPPRAPSVSTPP